MFATNSRLHSEEIFKLNVYTIAILTHVIQTYYAAAEPFQSEMNNPVCIEEDVISGIHILISKLIRKED
jgi:hypothetical protein